jgi:hypothetical protein
MNTRNKFSFGGAVYTDWAEGREKLFEYEPLSGNALAFFNREGYHQNDPDDPEAVYYALKNALRLSGMSSKENNIIILIGDAGNHERNDPSQVDPNAIINLLVDLDCHFLTFQVHHEGRKAYNDFNLQAKMIAEQTAQRSYAKFSDLGSQFTDLIYPPTWDKTSGNIYKMLNGAYGAWIFGLNPGEKLAPERLTNEIENFINYMNDRNNKLISIIHQINDGSAIKSINILNTNTSSEFSKYSSSLAPGVIAFLKNAGLSKDQLEMAQREKFQLYMDAPTPIKINNQKYPLFKSVLLLSREELGELCSTMDKLADALSGSDARERLIDTWVDLVKSYEGKLTRNDIENMKPEEISDLIFDLPTTSELLHNIRLRDIRNPDLFRDETLGDYMRIIREKQQNLREIFRSDVRDYKYSFRSNEIPYYWISEEMLP